MSALTNLQATIQSSFSALSVRERRLVIGGIAAVAVFIVLFTAVSFNNTANAIRTRTTQKLSKFDEVLTLASHYREAKAVQEAAERQLSQSNVKLLSFVSETAKAQGLDFPPVSPKPEVPIEGNAKIYESALDLQLTDVKLNRLVDFLKAIESGPGVVKVKYLRLEPRVKEETITASMTIATYHLKN